MGWNQVSLIFYTSRWQEHLTPHPTALTYTGEPVQIASAVPVAGAEASRVAVGAVIEWLSERGFTPVEWGQGRVFERGRVQSPGGAMPDVIVHVNGDSDDVTDLYCRFTLPGRKPPDVAGWAALVADLCGRFGLRLAPDGVGPCDAAAFVAAVRANHNYREFAASRGWQ